MKRRDLLLMILPCFLLAGAGWYLTRRDEGERNAKHINAQTATYRPFSVESVQIFDVTQENVIYQDFVKGDVRVEVRFSIDDAFKYDKKFFINRDYATVIDGQGRQYREFKTPKGKDFIPIFQNREGNTEIHNLYIRISQIPQSAKNLTLKYSAGSPSRSGFSRLPISVVLRRNGKNITGKQTPL
jgi:hypothetical protein